MGKYDGIQDPALRNAAVAVVVIVLIGVVVFSIFHVLTNDADAPTKKSPKMSTTTIYMSSN